MSGGKELDVPAGRMAVPLMRHQRLALAWMLHRERTAANPRGGILADDQGLGKTVSTIALIVTNQHGDDVADEGFEDLTSDLEVDDVDGMASAETAGHSLSSVVGEAAPAIANGHDVGSKVPPGTLTQSLSALSVPSPDHAFIACHQAAASADEQASRSEAQLAAAAEHANNTSAANTQNGTFHSHKAASGHQRPPKQPSAEQEPGNIGRLPEGGTLIICPTAVLSQWSRELSSKVAPPAGKTHCYCSGWSTCVGNSCGSCTQSHEYLHCWSCLARLLCVQQIHQQAY